MHLLIVLILMRRKLCTYFKLPGEAAQIDRIMQTFAEKYCLQNSGIFKEADDAYIVIFNYVKCCITSSRN